MAKGLSYRDAGVDIEAGDALVEAIKPLARRTLRPEVLAGIGGFGALCQIPKKYRQPVLVSGTDGVGTKLKLAFELRRHDTVGIDLVAMSVNDILVCGRSEEHTSELQSPCNLVCRLLLEKKKLVILFVMLFMQS